MAPKTKPKTIRVNFPVAVFNKLVSLIAENICPVRLDDKAPACPKIHGKTIIKRATDCKPCITAWLLKL